MRTLLNTLYITSENAYAALDGENIVIKKHDQITARFPLHNLQSIVSFSYAGASPALMGACAKSGFGVLYSAREIPREDKRREQRECPAQENSVQNC